MDISTETIRDEASMAIFRRIRDPEVDESVLHAYALHIDQGIRASTMGEIRKRGLHHLTMDLLQSKDPRGRHSGLMGVSALPKPMPDEVAGLLTAMIEDPDESWWVVMEALKNLENASADQLAPHVEAIEKWLTHDDWWLQGTAIQASTALALDERFYERMIPQIARIIATNQRPGVIGYFLDIARKTRNADAPIQKFAKEQFSKAYVSYPEMISAPGEQDMSAGTEYMLRHVARTVAETPGGLDALYEVAKMRFPDVSLPHKDLYLEANPSRLGPELQGSMKQIIVDDLIPEYIGTGSFPQSNRGYLMNEATSSEPLEWGFYYRRPRMEGLVDLYQRAIDALERYGRFAEVTRLGRKLLPVLIRNDNKFTQQLDPFTGAPSGQTEDGYSPMMLAALEYLTRMHGTHLAVADGGIETVPAPHALRRRLRRAGGPGNRP